jgi:hypothetical protein
MARTATADVLCSGIKIGVITFGDADLVSPDPLGEGGGLVGAPSPSAMPHSPGAAREYGPTFRHGIGPGHRQRAEEGDHGPTFRHGIGPGHRQREEEHAQEKQPTFRHGVGPGSKSTSEETKPQHFTTGDVQSALKGEWRPAGGVDRISTAKELAGNDALIRRYATMTYREVNQGASDRALTAQAETAANRAIKRNHSLERALWGTREHGQAGYYPPSSIEGHLTDDELAHFKSHILPRVLSGSDVVKGMTGNASDAPGNMVRSHQIARGTPYTDEFRKEGGDTYFDEDVGKPLPRLPGKPIGVTRLPADVPKTEPTTAGTGKSAAIRMAPGRTAEGSHMELNTLDPRLRDIVGSGAANFEAAHPGYTVEAFSGRRHGHDQGPHASEAGALDMQIRGPHGVIASEGSDPTGMYRELAKHARGVQLEKYPDLSKRFNWGGAFETKAGSGTPDLMHFDLSGVRGHFDKNLITNLPPK